MTYTRKDRIEYALDIDGVKCVLLLRPEIVIKKPPLSFDSILIKLNITNGKDFVGDLKMLSRIKIDDEVYVKILDSAMEKISQLRDDIRKEILIKNLAGI